MSSMMQCLLLGLLNLTRSPQLFNIFDTLSARRWYQQPFPITEMERHRVCEGSLWQWWLCQWHCRDQVWETHSYQGLFYSFTEHRLRIYSCFFCNLWISYRFVIKSFILKALPSSGFFSPYSRVEVFWYFILQEGMKYTLRLKNHGSMRTLNGDGGIAKVRCPDGTNFSFQACSLSTNGTNHMRGQIPQILYYR